MCNNPDKSHVEAWKSVIDFCKTVISVSSAILTALLGYYIVSQTELSDSWGNFLPPAFLVLTIALAIWGFGRSIKSVSSGTSQRGGILLANLSIIVLIIGILSISLVEIEKDLSLDGVISNIEKESQNINKQLVPQRVRTVRVSGSIYTITYDTDKGPVRVCYSTSEQRITGIQ